MPQRKFLLLLSLSVITLSSCEKKELPNDQQDNSFCIPDSMLKNILIDTVKLKPVESELMLPGKITYNEDQVIKVHSVVSGHVSELKVSLGDYVQKGQTLAVIRSTEMAGFISDFNNAKAELTIAKKNLEVAQDMHQSGVTSDRDLLIAQNEYQKALSAYNRINEVTKLYGAVVNKDDANMEYIIKSPISGFVVEKNLNAGMDLRSDESSALFTISDLKEVYAVASVYETDIAKLQTGLQAQITTISYPDKIYKGKIEKIASVMDSDSKTIAVKIKLSNPDYVLKPGMFASISVFFNSTEQGLCIPLSSLIFDDNRQYVIAYRKRCDLSIVPVEIIKKTGNEVYVRADGLKNKDGIISKGELFVFTEMKKR
jgi:cobalt-zinc-cadmium efflux system membrane fusion protein